eukprot:SAG22_NODE_904_length_6586_cov_3.133498_8_plen_317_part_00
MQTPVRERSAARRDDAVTMRMLSDRSSSWGGGCGSSVWAASAVLCRWLCSDRRCMYRTLCAVEGKTVIELGAGIGMAGMVCAKSGAKQVLLTDLPRQIPLLRRNITENFGPQQRKVESSALSWGAQTPLPRPDSSRSVRAGWDLIVCSDLVYDAEEIPLLADTLARLLAHRGAKALCAFPDRTDFGRRRWQAATEDSDTTVAARRQRPWVECGITSGWWPSADGMLPDFDLLFELLSKRARQQAWAELVVARMARFSAEEAGTLSSAIHLFVLELRPAVHAQQLGAASNETAAAAVAADDGSSADRPLKHAKIDHA